MNIQVSATSSSYALEELEEIHDSNDDDNELESSDEEDIGSSNDS